MTTELDELISGWNVASLAVAVPERVQSWDAVVLTASAPQQRKLYEAQLQRAQRNGRLPASCRCMVIEDPQGKRIGSGGATLGALAAVHQALGADTAQAKVLIVHAGGDSRRLPWANILGKAFLPLPLLATEDEPVPTLFDHLLALAAGAAANYREGGALILTGDVLPLAHLSAIPTQIDGAAVVTTPVPLDTASRHGVIIDGGNNIVRKLVQKASPEQLTKEGLVDGGSALLDTGVLHFSGAAWRGLLTAALDERNPVEQLLQAGSECSLYEDIAGAMVAANHGQVAQTTIGPLLIEHLGEQQLHHHRDDQFRFVHLGTTGEYLDHLRRHWSGQLQRRLLTNIQSNVDRSATCLLSTIGKNVVLGGHSLVYASQLNDDIVIGRRCCVVASIINEVGFILPDHHCFWQVPIAGIASGNTVSLCVGVDDNPKAPLQEATFCNRSLQQWMDSRGVSSEELWSESDHKILWNAKLFPVHNKEHSLTAMRWMMHDEAEDGATAWRDSERLALADLASNADAASLWTQLDELTAALVQEILEQQAQRGQDRDCASLLRQVEADDARARIGALADTALPAYLPHSRRLRIQADLAAAVDRQQARSLNEQAVQAVVNEVGLAVGRHHAAAVQGIPSDTEAHIQLPARFDFAGGWSDTPPWCLERPARVVNLAIGLNGSLPISCQVRAIDAAEWRCFGDENSQHTFTNAEVAAGPTDLSHPFHLVATALRCCGYGGATGISQGVEITICSAVPRGSGLGTSSILGAAIIAALQELCERPNDHQSVSDLVLVLEQTLGTGGGWQDQVGGLYPGAKSIISLPTRPLTLSIDAVPLRPETIDELQSRFVLAFTGQERLAKNVLQIVVGRYLGRDARLIHAIEELVDLADAARAALAGGDIDQLGHVMASAWRAHQLLDPRCSNPGVDNLFAAIDDYCLGIKLAGAGGGGFMGALAKDATAAARCKTLLQQADPRVRIFDWNVHH